MQGPKVSSKHALCTHGPQGEPEKGDVVSQESNWHTGEFGRGQSRASCLIIFC